MTPIYHRESRLPSSAEVFNGLIEEARQGIRMRLLTRGDSLNDRSFDNLDITPFVAAPAADYGYEWNPETDRNRLNLPFWGLI